MTRTLDLGMRVILRDPQEFLAEIGVVLQDPPPYALETARDHKLRATKIPSFLPERNFALHEMSDYNL